MLKVELASPGALASCANLGLEKLLDDAERCRWLDLWRAKVSEGAALACLVRDTQDQVAGFWLTFGLVEPFVEQLRRSFGSICRRVLWMPSAIASHTHFLNAHRGRGIDLAMCYTLRSNLTPSEANQVRHLLYQSFLTMHRGLHLRSIWCEVSEDADVDCLQDLGMSLLASRECGAFRGGRGRSYLMEARRERLIADGRVGTPLYGLFLYESPTVRLSHTARSQIQLGVIAGLDDRAISEALQSSEASVRQRWHRLRLLLEHQLSVDAAQLRSRASLLRWLSQVPHWWQPLRYAPFLCSKGQQSINPALALPKLGNSETAYQRA